jgi:hypothetical protein
MVLNHSLVSIRVFVMNCDARKVIGGLEADLGKIRVAALQ